MLCVDPYQIPQNVVSNLGLHCLSQYIFWPSKAMGTCLSNQKYAKLQKDSLKTAWVD